MAQRDLNPNTDTTHRRPLVDAEPIQLVFDRFQAFVDEYRSKISVDGMFLETEEARPLGATVSCEFKLTDGFRLCKAMGQVSWTRPRAVDADRPAGVGIRFQVLDDQGRALIQKIVEEHVKNGGQPFSVEPPPDVAAGPPAPPPPPAPPLPPAPREDPAATHARPALRMTDLPSDDSPPSFEVDSLPQLEPVFSESGMSGSPAAGSPPAGSPAAGSPAAGSPPAGSPAADFKAPWGQELPTLPDDVIEPIDEEAALASAHEDFSSDAGEAGFSSDESELLEIEPLDPEPLAEEPILDDPLAGEPLAPDFAAPLAAAPEAPDEIFFADEPLTDEPLADEPPADDPPADDPPAVDLTGPSEVDFGFDSPLAAAPDFSLLAEASTPEFDLTDDTPPATLVQPPDFLDADEEVAGLTAEPELKSTDVDEPLTAEPTPAARLLAEVDEPLTAELAEVDEPLTAEPLAPSAEPPPPPEVEAAFQPWKAEPGGDGELMAPDPPETGALLFDVDEPLVGEPDPTPVPESPSPEPDTPPAELFPSTDFAGVDPPLTTELPDLQGTPGDLAGAAPSESSNGPDLAKGPADSADILSTDPTWDTDEADDEWGDSSADGGFMGHLKLALAESKGRILLVVALLAAVGASLVFKEQILQLAGLGSPPIQDVSAPPLAEPDGPGSPAALPADTEPGGGETAEEATGPDAAGVATGPEVIEVAAEPSPTAPPSAPPPTATGSSNAATRVESLTFDQIAEGTRVTIVLNGALPRSRYDHHLLDYDSLKEQVVLRGIDTPFSSQVAVGTLELDRIRSGLHGDELKLVFDFSSEVMTLSEIRPRGNQLEILVRRR